MRKFFVIIALCVLSLAACKKNEIAAPKNNVTIQFVSDGVDTKTTLDADGHSVSWNKTGEYLQVFRTAGEEIANVKSAEAVVTDNKAKFAVTFSAVGGSVTYNAVYPAGSYVSGNPNAVVVNLPDVQKPAKTSFDSAADLLIAKPVVSEGDINSEELLFKRLVALAKLKFTGLDNDTALIDYILFSVSKGSIAGNSTVNLSTSEVSEYGTDNVSEIKLDYRGRKFDSKKIAATGLTAYLSCLPINLGVGDSFTVTVVTSRKIYKKTVTLSKPLVVNAGESQTFNLNMTGTEIPVEFPVVFPLGYPTLSPEAANESYNYRKDLNIWMEDWCYYNNVTYYNKHSVDHKGEAGIWHCMTQPQAYMRWVWDEAIVETGVSHFTEVAASKESDIKTGSPGIKGVWTGDFWEMVVPVKNIAAGTTFKLTAPLFTSSGAPVLWDVYYYDGGEWKATDRQSFTLTYGDETTTQNATWKIMYRAWGSTDKNDMNISFTLANPIEDGELKIKIQCVDGSWYDNKGAYVKGTTPKASSNKANATFYFYNPYGSQVDPSENNVKLEIVN